MSPRTSRVIRLSSRCSVEQISFNLYCSILISKTHQKLITRGICYSLVYCWLEESLPNEIHASNGIINQIRKHRLYSHLLRLFIQLFQSKTKNSFFKEGGRHIFLTAITLITINLLTETCKIKKRLKLYSKRQVILKKIQIQNQVRIK